MKTGRSRVAALRAVLILGAAAATAIALPAGKAEPPAQEHQHGASKPAARAPSASAKKDASQAATNGCSVCLEQRPLQNPSIYAGWNDTDVKKAYEAARKYPATLDLIHCFCECKESPREHHKTLLTCFTNEHAAGCGICQHEAILAAKLKDDGASDEEVEFTVESLHKTDKHPPTKGRGI
ncbi:MAG TPA: PCYCGC motif-containing (lipo)protein [Thermoanaerobaculia bacterium]|nr:PCYCGC motif-containing (lipo)protein [Thermoanaerobaculia bacterium]